MEIKTCRRCKNHFACKAEDIKNCQCSLVKLKQAQLKHISKQYDDCLCANCLNKIIEEVKN